MHVHMCIELMYCYTSFGIKVIVVGVARIVLDSISVCEKNRADAA